MAIATRRANRRGGAGAKAAVARREHDLTVELNAKQDEFVFSPERFTFYVGGRGAGKTTAGALRAILVSQELPGSVGLVSAPTHPMLRDAAQRTFFELCPPSLIADHLKGNENHTYMVNGSEILWRPSFKIDRHRGLNLAWFWMDEAPYCGYDAWSVLKPTLRQPGYPTLGWATGSPRGRDKFARDFELEPRRRHRLIRASTYENAHNLPEDFVPDLGYTGQLEEQEIFGLFVAFQGLVYQFDASSDGHVRAWAGESFKRVVGGLDWGGTNPYAAVVIGLDGDLRAWQIDEFYQRRVGLEEVVIPAVVSLTKRHDVARWWCDSADPEAIAKLNAALAREGLSCRAVGVKKGPGSVRAGIQTVTTAMGKRLDGTRGFYVDPRCVATIGEFGSYQYESETAKRDPAEEPRKQGDHSMDAVRYCLHSELAGSAATEAYLLSLVRKAKELASVDREGLAVTVEGGDGNG